MLFVNLKLLKYKVVCRLSSYIVESFIYLVLEALFQVIIMRIFSVIVCHCRIFSMLYCYSQRLDSKWCKFLLLMSVWNNEFKFVLASLLMKMEVFLKELSFEVTGFIVDFSNLRWTCIRNWYSASVLVRWHFIYNGKPSLYMAYMIIHTCYFQLFSVSGFVWCLSVYAA